MTHIITLVGKEENKMIRYYVCGLGYDENGDANDYEVFFGDFDTSEEAYALFNELEEKDAESFFVDAPKVYEINIRLEECEETEEETECIDILDEFGIINPDFKKDTMNRQQFVDYVHDNFNVSVEFLRLLDHVLEYTALQNFDDDDLHMFLNFMLDCGIGIGKDEIDRVKLQEEEN